MRLKSVEDILNCCECKNIVPNSLPIADGRKQANILVLTQDPAPEAQEYMNENINPTFIYDPSKNDFAHRISNYLLGSYKEEYNPHSARYIEGFNENNFVWIHTSNVHVGSNISKLKKPGIHMREKHLPAVTSEMLRRNKEILLIILGCPAAKSVQNDWKKTMEEFIRDGVDISYLDKRVEMIIGYHPGNNAWDTMKDRIKPIAQARVAEIRRKVKSFLEMR